MGGPAHLHCIYLWPSVLVLEDLDHVIPHVSNAQEQVQLARFSLWRPEVEVGEC